jgi:hypothetical protein
MAVQLYVINVTNGKIAKRDIGSPIITIFLSYPPHPGSESSRSASSRADLACVAGAGQAGHGLSAVSSKPSADMVVRCRCCDIRRVLAPQLQRHRAGRKPVYSITRSMRRMRACQGRLPQLHVVRFSCVVLISL